jgi:hypothetical protein
MLFGCSNHIQALFRSLFSQSESDPFSARQFNDAGLGQQAPCPILSPFSWQKCAKPETLNRPAALIQ